MNKDTTFNLLTAKPQPKINFGRIDCSVPVSRELCFTFLLTSNFRLPEIYHVVSYVQNGTTEIRQFPLHALTNVTEADQVPKRISKFFLDKEWKNVEPWTDILNPITGFLG